MFFVSSFVPILSPQEDSTMQISSESPGYGYIILSLITISI